MFINGENDRLKKNLKIDITGVKWSTKWKPAFIFTNIWENQFRFDIDLIYDDLQGVLRTPTYSSSSSLWVTSRLCLYHSIAKIQNKKLLLSLFYFTAWLYVTIFIPYMNNFVKTSISRFLASDTPRYM